MVFRASKAVYRRQGCRSVRRLWPAEGLYAWVDGRLYNLALETPFVAAAWRDPTLLPKGFLVVGLGEKVVLLNLRTRELAVLATGSGPAVLLDLSDAPKRPGNVMAR